MKKYLKNALENLNPIGECSALTKYESICWGFEQGYSYRKSLSLTGLSHEEYNEHFKGVNNLLGKTPEVKKRDFTKTIDANLCPKCLINPVTEKIFNEHDIKVKLYGAKYRSIIDADQLIKLLDYLGVKE